LGGAPGVAGAAAGGLSEAQIRQNLIDSGQFAREGGEVRLVGSTLIVPENLLPPGEVSRGQVAADLERRGLINQQQSDDLTGGFINISTGAAGGGVDQASLDAEVRRQLAAQGAGAAGVPGQTALEAQQAAFQSLVESPGQRFIRSRAEQGVTRQAAALGGLGGGQVRTALTQQAAGFAQQDLQNRFARLQTLIGGGQTAATNLGSFGQQQAATAGGLLQAGAQARAGGILGAQQAQAQQGSNIAGLIGAGLSFFSDERLKTDIHDLDLKQCFEAVMDMPLKAWKYLEETGLDQDAHMGVMAQDAPQCIKGEAINGYSTLNLHDELTLIMGALQYACATNKVN